MGYCIGYRFVRNSFDLALQPPRTGAVEEDLMEKLTPTTMGRETVGGGNNKWTWEAILKLGGDAKTQNIYGPCQGSVSE